MTFKKDLSYMYSSQTSVAQSDGDFRVADTRKLDTDNSLLMNNGKFKDNMSDLNNRFESNSQVNQGESSTSNIVL